jgi:hypothetical protein
MTSLDENAIRVDDEAAARGRDERLMAMLASMPVGLTPEQFDRLMKAIEGRGGLLSDLHKLSDLQQAVVDAYGQVERAMGIDGLKPDLVQPVRDGCEVVVQIPAGARKVRVFLQSSYVTVDAGYDRDGFSLPECVGSDDRITRLEFLDERGVVLGVTGGERRVIRGK